MALANNLQPDNSVLSGNYSSQNTNGAINLHGEPQTYLSIERNYPDPVSVEGFNVVFTPSRRKTTRRISISVSGDFSVKHIHLLHQPLKQVLANYDFIDFQLKDITRLDLAAIQFLCITCRTNPDRKLCIEARFEKEVTQLIEASGFGPFFLAANPAKYA